MNAYPVSLFALIVLDVIENPDQGMWYTFQLLDPEGM